MPFYEKGDVRIRYEEAGAGFPLLVTPGGGLNSSVSNWPTAVFNAMEEFKNEFRCITMDQRNANGGPFALKLMEQAPDRVVAGVLCQPVGHRPENPDVMYHSGRDTWAPELLARRPDLTLETLEAYLHHLYRVQPDFVYSVSRDFVRACQTPMLVMPDDTPAHPYPVAMEIAALAPKAEVTVYPWREPKDLLAKTINQVRDFLRAHQPATAAR